MKPKVGKNKGNAGKGRPKGSLNKSTAILKDAVLKAASEAGNGDIVTYLARAAKENPGPFLALLGKIIPLQLSGTGDPIQIQIVRFADASDDDAKTQS